MSLNNGMDVNQEYYRLPQYEDKHHTCQLSICNVARVYKYREAPSSFTQ